MTNARRVLVHADRDALAGALAARFITKVVDLLDQQDEVNVVLTGGTVGIGVLRSINESPARDSIDWSRMVLWWGDERWLPRGDAERNDTQARDALLDHVALQPANIHWCPASDELDDIDAAAALYGEQLATAAPDEATVPRFDITFLGVGPDGHVASLFPESAGILVQDATVIAVRNSPKPPPERLSLTLPVINSSDRIWLALSGTDKASALGLALAGASMIEVPVAGVEGRLRTVFFVDRDAAAEVPEELIATEY
ncbi:MAG TPA: 6-phosphogluconolactonase [Lacisediminihabitans sp.]|uniref:6-phosphogluconolactonase n=1 Tax=Lacisediminihabitans sp. TaxID=2787631 RepID=UPI002EDA566C